MHHTKTLITSYIALHIVLRDHSSFTPETFFTTDNNSRVNQNGVISGVIKKDVSFFLFFFFFYKTAILGFISQRPVSLKISSERGKGRKLITLTYVC